MAGLEGLPEALDGLAEAAVEVIAINGGDGSVSAVLTELMARPRFEELPPLALLRGGTLNMCAADVGLKGTPEAALARLVQRAGAGELTSAVAERHVIRLQRDAPAPPIYGMFLAMGSLYRAVRFSYEEVPGRAQRPRTHAARTFLSLIGRHLFGADGAGKVLRGDQVSLGLDGAPAEPLNLLLAMVTTLDHLVLNVRPYWGGGPGGLRVTALTYPPDRLVRRAIRVLYGGAERGLPARSYRSHNAQRAVIEPALPFALDGELYDATPGRRIELSAAGPLRFLTD